jgi:uncharacterized protein YhbP (UPF0306 family)
MNKPDKPILKFIKKHHVLTLATSNDDHPWCAHCFYTFYEDEGLFIFTSDSNTKHVKDAKINSRVAGAIALETTVIGKIQGLQLTGSMFEPVGNLLDKVKHLYIKRFPFALLMETQIWVLEADYMKLTDNRLGFGKKLIWKKEVN